MKKLLFSILFLIPIMGFSQGTFSVVNNMNVCIAKPANYTTAKKYPVIMFFTGLGEVGTNKDLLVKYGVNAYVKQGWDLKAGGVEFIAVSIQPNVAFIRTWALNPVILSVLSTLSYDPAKVYATGLSLGGANAKNDVQYYREKSVFKVILDVQGMKPDDNWQMQVGGEPYPQSFKPWANGGGKYVGFDQKYDGGRDLQTVVNVMNSQVAGSGIYIQTTFGNGGHCCWDDFYGGNGTQPAKFAQLGNKNIYEYLASLGGGTVTPEPPIEPPVQCVTKAKYDSLLNLYVLSLSTAQKQIVEINNLKQQAGSLNYMIGNLKEDLEERAKKLDLLYGTMKQMLEIFNN